MMFRKWFLDLIDLHDELGFDAHDKPLFSAYTENFLDVVLKAGRHYGNVDYLEKWAVKL